MKLMITKREIYEFDNDKLARARYIASITELYSITGRSDVKYDIQGYNRMRRNIEI